MPPDVEAFQQAQSLALGSAWLPAAGDRGAAAEACTAASALDPASDDFRELVLRSIYALAHFPDSEDAGHLKGELSQNRLLVETIANWLRRHRPPADSPSRCALDVGCGPGGLFPTLAPLFPDGVLGLDLRVGMLRVARRLTVAGEVILPFCVEGQCFEPLRIVASGTLGLPVHLVQGDILAPPFEAEVFPVVVASSVLDTLPDPMVGLGQLDALLAPGGLLLVATPYYWQPQVTPPQEWWSHSGALGAETLRKCLRASHPALPHLSYEILEQAENMPWSLPANRRLVHRFFLDVILARKRA